jgi:hypothetical protein
MRPAGGGGGASSTYTYTTRKVEVCDMRYHIHYTHIYIMESFTSSKQSELYHKCENKRRLYLNIFFLLLNATVFLHRIRMVPSSAHSSALPGIFWNTKLKQATADASLNKPIGVKKFEITLESCLFIKQQGYLHGGPDHHKASNRILSKTRKVYSFEHSDFQRCSSCHIT